MLREELRNWHAMEARAVESIEVAIRAYDPIGVFGMLSGGYDSYAATLLAAQSSRFAGVLHINTGIGIEDTRTWVRETCELHDWELFEQYPPAASYEDFVLAKGFPGPAAHLYCYSWLKERAIRQFVRERKAAAGGGRLLRLLLVTGVREQESKRRMGKAERYSREGARVWVAPILEWPATAPRWYVNQRMNLHGNPVTDHLHMSGECKCGAFASPGERELTAAFYPEFEDYLQALEFDVARRGLPARWGERPPRGASTYPIVRGIRSTLCSSCEVQPTGEEL